MDIRELRSFCAVAELRSVTKAAERLSIGQPAVTLHIKALEDEFGVRLLDRTKRPLRLTAAGMRLLELANPLLYGVDALPSIISGREDVRDAVLAVTNELSGSPIAQGLDLFKQRNPDTGVTIKAGRTAEVLHLLRSHEADLALMPVSEGATDVENIAIFVTSRVVITPLGHPLLDKKVNLSAIAQHPLVIANSTSDTPSYLEEPLYRNGLNFNTVMELESCAAVKRHVAAGIGVSVLPGICIEPDDAGRLGIVRGVAALPRHRMALARLTGRYLPPPAIDLARTLTAALRLRFDAIAHDTTESLADDIRP